MDPGIILSFIGATVLFTLAPGPDNMYLTAKSLSVGARAGIALALGLSLGPAFHTVLVMAGVSAFIKNSPEAFRLLTGLGICYLLFLAWKAWRAKPQAQDFSEEGNDFSFFALTRQGILMNVLNPKVLLFFMALLPQFVKLESSLSPAWQIGILGIVFSIQSFIVFSLLALGASKIRGYLSSEKNFFAVMHKIEAVVLVVIASGLFFL